MRYSSIKKNKKCRVTHVDGAKNILPKLDLFDLNFVREIFLIMNIFMIIMVKK